MVRLCSPFNPEHSRRVDDLVDDLVDDFEKLGTATVLF